VKKAEIREGTNPLERLAFMAWAWVMRHPRLYEMACMAAASLSPSGDGGGWVRSVPLGIKVPPVDAWLSQRDLPSAPAKSFRQLWRERR